MVDLKYISKGNIKTGCFSFDLPARSSCPGKTKECARDCYAAQTMRLYPSVKKKYGRNRRFVNADKFVAYMVETIPADCQFRIHVSGDFFSIEYIQKWIEIASRRQDVMFYAYTRSWRVHQNPDQFWIHLYSLNRLPNVNINLSVDDETGMPDFPTARIFRWCYLTKTDSVPDWIRKDDIVFRSNHNGHKTRRKNAEKKGLNPDDVAPVIKRLGGQVCPKEQGLDVPKLSCAKCKLCVVKPKVPANAM